MPHIDITTLMTEIKTSTVAIGVKVVTPEARTYLIERFGPGVRVIEHDGFVDLD